VITAAASAAIIQCFFVIFSQGLEDTVKIEYRRKIKEILIINE
jgi:hypothetical protein